MDASREKVSREQLKQMLLLTFVLICVVLVSLIWWQALAGDGGRTPGYVRSTPLGESPAANVTVSPPVDTESAQPGGSLPSTDPSPVDPYLPPALQASPQGPQPTMSLMDQ